MACARCGCGVYQTEDIITLNKIWHKCCFTCYRCKKKLDKCSAKIFQGEVFCDCCYNCLLEKLELLSSPSKPCRVVSSPSCICEKQKCSKPAKVLPPFCNSAKCGKCCQVKQRANFVKASLSCSCIPDRKVCSGKKDLYCFAFPIPREVANYYSRAHAMPKPNCCCLETPCCRPKKPVCVKVRSLSPPPCCPNCRQTTCRSRPCYQPSPTCCCSQQPQCFPPQPQCCPPQPECCSPQPQCCPAPPPPPCSSEKCCCSKCCPPTRCKGYPCSPIRPSCPKRCTPPRRKPCTSCCQEVNRKPECIRKPPQCRCCPVREEKCPPCSCKLVPKCFYSCGNSNPCSCKICQVRAICTPSCNRCGCKVYAAEKISVTKGAYHTSCFSCLCCNKLLDLKNFYENCGEIYCKQCYNNTFGNQFYGYGSSQFC